MWYFQKKEQSKELIIKKRISALYDKMYLIYDTKTDENCTSKIYISIFRVENQWYQYKLNTIYGIRYLLINQDKNILFYGKDFKFDFKIYKDSPEDDFTKIFEIKFFCKRFNIYPNPMVELTPKEIDLAILEFEESIEKSFQIALTRKSKHDECVKYFSKEI